MSLESECASQTTLLRCPGPFAPSRCQQWHPRNKEGSLTGKVPRVSKSDSTRDTWATVCVAVKMQWAIRRRKGSTYWGSHHREHPPHVGKDKNIWRWWWGTRKLLWELEKATQKVDFPNFWVRSFKMLLFNDSVNFIPVCCNAPILSLISRVLTPCWLVWLRKTQSCLFFQEKMVCFIGYFTLV